MNSFATIAALLVVFAFPTSATNLRSTPAQPSTKLVAASNHAEQQVAKPEEKKVAKKEETKKDAGRDEKKEDAGKKKDKKAGPCATVKKLDKEIEKIAKKDPAVGKLMDKHLQKIAKGKECDQKKARKATKNAEKNMKKANLGNAAKMQGGDKDFTRDGKAHAKTSKAVNKQEKDIDKAGFEAGKKGKGDKKAAGKKEDKKGKKKEEKEKAKKALIQTSACVFQDMTHRAQLQNKLAGVCVDMCKEVGAFPKCTCPDFVAPDSTPGVMTWPELLEHLDNLSLWGHGQMKAWTKQASELQIEGLQTEKACLADDLKHRTQVQNKLAGVCVDMCKEVGAFPKCTCPDFVAPDSTPGVMTWPELLEHMDNLSEWGHGELKAWTSVAR